MSVCKLRMVVVIVILCSNASFSQDQIGNAFKKRNTWQTFTYDMGVTLKSIGHSYTRPLNWESKQWQTFGGVAAGTGLIYLFDEESSRFIGNQRASIPNAIRTYGNRIGNPGYNYMFTGGVYLTGLFTKDDKLRRTGVLLIASASSAGLLQQILKTAVGRARPNSDKGKDTFDPFNSNRDYHSFPSGHTILAFTNAYAIAKQFKNPWLKAGIYTAGLVPGVSRIWDGQHWLSDVALGVAISIFTVESIDKYLDKKYAEKYNDQEKKLSWNLSILPGQIGLTARF